MSVDEIDLALRQAEAYLAEGTQEPPEGELPSNSYARGLTGHSDTALGKFQEVLAVDPENQRAKDGVAAVAAFFRKVAARTCEAKAWIGCAVYANRGLEALPDDPELLKLKETAEAAQRGL